jgi:hypothetical protein
VKSAKILGLILSDDLKWNEHVLKIVKKARKRLYCLAQLKRSNVGTKELLQFCLTCIRPITEYVCPIFHNSLTTYLSNDLEPIQKRALRIIIPYGRPTVRLCLLQDCNLSIPEDKNLQKVCLGT